MFIIHLCCGIKISHSYTDDFKIYRIIFTEKDCDSLQEDLNVINRWCDENFLPLNKKNVTLSHFLEISNRLLIPF